MRGSKKRLIERIRNRKGKCKKKEKQETRS